MLKLIPGKVPRHCSILCAPRQGFDPRHGIWFLWSKPGSDHRQCELTWAWDKFAAITRICSSLNTHPVLLIKFCCFIVHFDGCLMLPQEKPAKGLQFLYLSCFQTLLCNTITFTSEKLSYLLYVQRSAGEVYNLSTAPSQEQGHPSWHYWGYNEWMSRLCSLLLSSRKETGALTQHSATEKGL